MTAGGVILHHGVHTGGLGRRPSPMPVVVIGGKRQRNGVWQTEVGNAMPEPKWSGRKLQRMTRVVQVTYGWTCWLCKQDIDQANYSIDHVVPRSKGGDVWDLDNMRPAHKRCNSSRGNRPPSIIITIPKPSRQW